MVEEGQEAADGANAPGFGRTRGDRLGLYAAIVGSVFLGYGVPIVGFLISIAVLVALLIVRRELWGAAVPPSALLVVLVWIGLWLPAISYRFTEWYWYLTGGEVSTAWLLFPIQGPTLVGTLVPALAAAVVFAVGLKVSAVLNRQWLVIVGAWLAPWAHQLAYIMVAES